MGTTSAMSSDFSQYYEAREPGRRERAYGWATAIDLQAATGLSRRGVEWNLKSLKSRGLIRRVGPSRGGHWEVCQ